MTPDKPILPQRVVQRMEDLDADELRVLACAEVPARFAYLDEFDIDQEMSSSPRP